MPKPLIITSTEHQKEGHAKKWISLTNINSFIPGIETGKADSDATAEAFYDMISGVPSPWARVKMTAYALGSAPKTTGLSMLDKCYASLRNEWRGLMAAYILNPDRFYLSAPIELKANDRHLGNGSMDIISTYAAALFDEKNLWQHVPGGLDQNPPTIQLLFYKDDSISGTDKQKYVLVGATSPYTILFAGVNYSIGVKSDLIVNGKFSDPTHPDNRAKFSAQPEVFRKIYSFLKILNDNLDTYIAKLKEILGVGKTDVANEIDQIFQVEVNAWLRDIRGLLGISGNTDPEPYPLTFRAATTPQGPLKSLFQTATHYYWYDNAFHRNSNKNETLIIEEKKVDVNDILIDSEYLMGWFTQMDVEAYNNAPVFYLPVRREGSADIAYHFALPLTEFGLSLFQSTLEGIISPNGSMNGVKLGATASAQNGIVKVTVKLESKLDTDEFVELKSVTYTAKINDNINKVFTWPNFKSEFWNKYYFYNEYPLNSNDVSMTPKFEGVTVFDNLEPEARSGMYLVRYPENARENDHRYEIIQSKTPLEYVKIKVRSNEKPSQAGLLVIKTSEFTQGTKFMKEIANMSQNQLNDSQKVTVGIDFGSTNTCAYYKKPNSASPTPVPFKNHRLALVGFDNTPTSLAEPNELLFISNEQPRNNNGQIKTWLHEHGPNYVNAANAADAISGGIPVNETNISVREMDSEVITTNVGKLNYNMKWLASKGENQRSAFLKMIWIHICADLFEEQLVTGRLTWSYPSSMKGYGSLGNVFGTFQNPDCCPVKGLQFDSPVAYTEAEAVCKYALTSNIKSLRPDTLYLGVDIGGSTSDILVLGMGPDPATGNLEKELLAQCSVRMAAGLFFNAINQSKDFRHCLYQFHESRTTDVKVTNIRDIVSDDPRLYKQAPYYLNNIFDQLKDRTEFKTFYEYLRVNNPAIFALPAYVTGLLCTYSGILIREAIEKRNLNMVNRISFRYYGKGGRMFEWLLFTFKDIATEYLKACIRFGFGEKLQHIQIELENLNVSTDSPMENKSEVAIGLVSLNDNDRIIGINGRCAPKPNQQAQGGFPSGMPPTASGAGFGSPFAAAPTQQAAAPSAFSGAFGGAFGGAQGSMPGDLQNNTSDEPRHDVIGERGIQFFENGQYRELNELDVITEKMFATNNLIFPQQLFNFNWFFYYYSQYLKMTGCLPERAINQLVQEAQQDPNLGTFFERDKNLDNIESYRMPIFIASGLKFLQDTLIPRIFNSNLR